MVADVRRVAGRARVRVAEDRLVPRDQHVVLRHHEVRLHVVRAELDREPVGLERVLGHEPAGPAVPDHERLGLASGLVPLVVLLRVRERRHHRPQGEDRQEHEEPAASSSSEERNRAKTGLQPRPFSAIARYGSAAWEGISHAGGGRFKLSLFAALTGLVALLTAVPAGAQTPPAEPPLANSSNVHVIGHIPGTPRE